MTVTDFPDYGQSQDQANKIAATGVPGLNLKTVVASFTGNVNNPGGNTVRGPFTFTQLSYEIGVSLETNVAPVGATVVDITLEWSDSASGLLVKRKSFQAVCGANGTPHTVEANGPARADTLNVTIANNASSGVASKVGMTILQSSRDYQEDSFRTINFQQSGFTGASPKLDYNVLGQFGTSVGAAGSQTRLMALYSGPVHVTANTTGNNATLQLTIAEAATATPLLGTDPDSIFVQSNASGFINETLYLPNIQQVLTVNNSDSSSHTINACIVGLNNPGD